MDKVLIYKEEVNNVVGCAFEVSNILGPGLLEKPYENALCVELEHRGIKFVKQKRFRILYKSIDVGEYIPDLIVFNKIIVEIKSIDKITNVERSQILNYL